MNKYQEALDYIINLKINNDFQVRHNMGAKKRNLILQELVDKATTMNKLYKPFGDIACKNCDNDLDYWDKYCSKCGQKLGWEETK